MVELFVIRKKRKDKIKVKLNFEKRALHILNAVVFNPTLLNLKEFNLTEWRAKDEAGRKQITHLQKWMRLKVFEKIDDKSYKIPEKWEGTLPQIYVDRLIEIVKHYEVISMSVIYSEDFTLLIDSLNGKTEEDDKALKELLEYKE